MQADLQKKLFAEINGYIDENSTKLAERELSHRAATYFDPAYTAKERAVIRSQPVIVGHASRLAAANDFLQHDDSGVPILVVRQEDGGLKAFLNVCRHRAARVCGEPTGNARAFTCPYHGWVYRSNGSLMAPPKSAFPSVDPAERGLFEIPVEERHGLVWVVTTAGATIDVRAHLGAALDDELSAYGMSDMVLDRDAVKREPINWKFPLDGFLEVYHIPKLHPQSIAPWIHGKYSPFDVMGLHSRMIGVRKSFEKVRGQPFEEGEFLKHMAVNYQVFPNTIIVWQGDHFELWTSYPGATPDSCTVRIQSIVPREMSGESFKKRWDRNWEIALGTVAAEDWVISQQIQKTLPFVQDGRILFGRNEPGLQHFHSVLDQVVEREGAAATAP
jgi:phenylpropionate dioxygenase-like ring-hydroxylating dioxygenase large terminal subunit